MTAPAASAPASAATPFKAVAPADAAPFGDGWLATVLVLAVFAAIAILLRRKLTGLPRPRGALRAVTVLESTRIGERMRLSVVRYRDRELLIAHGDQSATVLVDAAHGTAGEDQP
jgi:flagellar biogenesis protein FliO